MNQCDFCPLKKFDTTQTCIVTRNNHTRYCELINPQNPDYDERYIQIVLSKSNVVPRLIKRATNYIKSVTTQLFFGQHVPIEVINERLEKCYNCPELNENRTCRLCGCPIDEKTKFSHEKCPKEPSQWGIWESPITITNIPGKCGGCGS